MRRTPKVKIAAAPIPVRKSAVPAAGRRAFPAWIDAGDHGVAFSASAVMPRVRDALVLRVVSKGRRGATRSVSHGPGAR